MSSTETVLRFPANLLARMRTHLLKSEDEEFCFLRGHIIEAGNRTIGLVRDLVMPATDGYAHRSASALTIRAGFKNSAYLDFADSPFTLLVNAHSHPFSRGAVAFSATDDRDDLRELSWQASQLPIGKRGFGRDGSVLCASLVVGHGAMAARTLDVGGDGFTSIALMQEVGDPYRLHSPCELGLAQLAVADRQVRAFGADGQRVLAQLDVAIAGVGGLGSVVAEQVARLGVRRLRLIDDDRVSLTNLNRWQGGTPADVGRFKVEAMRDRLQLCVPDCEIEAVARPAYSAKARAALAAADLIIGCVDNGLARAYLNRLALQYLVPYIDIATEIGSAEGRPQPKLRLITVVPGVSACMDCSPVIAYDRAQTNRVFTDPVSFENLRNAGYITDLPQEPSPSVMPLNTIAGGIAGDEVLALATGYRPLSRYLRFDWPDINSRCLRLDGEGLPVGPDECCSSCARTGLGDSVPVDLPAFARERIRLPEVPAFEEMPTRLEHQSD
jgi:hypothetical protein